MSTGLDLEKNSIPGICLTSFSGPSMSQTELGESLSLQEDQAQPSMFELDEYWPGPRYEPDWIEENGVRYLDKSNLQTVAWLGGKNLPFNVGDILIDDFKGIMLGFIVTIESQGARSVSSNVYNYRITYQPNGEYLV